MSDLLIKGVDMPDSCSKCPLKYSSYDMYCCRAICGDGCIVCVDSYTERRNPACPLVEIPTPHGDLIDRDDLLTYFDRKAKGKTAEEALKLLYTALKAYPAVIGKEMNQ